MKAELSLQFYFVCGSYLSSGFSLEFRIVGDLVLLIFKLNLLMASAKLLIFAAIDYQYGLFLQF